jgi:hypothetical protein
MYGKRSKQINNIITEIKRWENIPNRREPVTKEMIKIYFNKRQSFIKIRT